jgi:hypothetical protein
VNITAILAGAAFVIGFGAAWNVQAWRWDAYVAELRQEQTSKLLESWADGERKALAAEDQKEAIQNEFNEFKQIEALRNASISAGVKRVYVRATCPAVSGAEANASGTSGGTVELDPAYRQTLSDLRSGAAEQLRLLNVCRAELKSRSAP